ncbi:hypothetical protein QBC45DRAFT_462703 [Copromyces sp. CBS 386.78]|nr:hypothetical protein QBC45DRAFT_462703 [Copromyces sp. CBS 386.78]
MDQPTSPSTAHNLQQPQFNITSSDHDQPLAHITPGYLNITVTIIRPPNHIPNAATDSAPIRHSHTETISIDAHTNPRSIIDSLSRLNNLTSGRVTLDDWVLDLVRQVQDSEVAAFPSQSSLSYTDAALPVDDSQHTAPNTAIGGGQTPEPEVQLPFPSLPPGGWDEVERLDMSVLASIPSRPTHPEPVQLDLDDDESAVAERIFEQQGVPGPGLSLLFPSVSNLQQPHMHAHTLSQADVVQSARSSPTSNGPPPPEHFFSIFDENAPINFTNPELPGERGQSEPAHTIPANAEDAEPASLQPVSIMSASPQTASSQTATSQNATSQTASSQTASTQTALTPRAPIILTKEWCIRTEMSVPRKYCEVKCIGKSRAQNNRKKERRPATRAGGGGSKKGDVGGRKKRRDGNGEGPGSGAAGAVLSGRVEKA